MKIIDCGPDAGAGLTSFGSSGVSRIRIHGGNGLTAVNVMHLAVSGRLGRHVAPVPQVLIVVQGRGWVSGSDRSPHAIEAGQAACWAEGEEHETWTDTGMMAVVVEAQAPAGDSLLSQAAQQRG
ncbi:hypothetical protein AB0D34_09635 [Streptomyces sp. NPDC048420]|uniref:cupin domain-containing protein n=1 Tax=Streptomyces sp. NPDC048420 TaxID=3155755 RepID=UPI00341F581C